MIMQLHEKWLEEQEYEKFIEIEKKQIVTLNVLVLIIVLTRGVKL